MLVIATVQVTKHVTCFRCEVSAAVPVVHGGLQRAPALHDGRAAVGLHQRSAFPHHGPVDQV